MAAGETGQGPDPIDQTRPGVATGWGMQVEGKPKGTNPTWNKRGENAGP